MASLFHNAPLNIYCECRLPQAGDSVLGLRCALWRRTPAGLPGRGCQGMAERRFGAVAVRMDKEWDIAGALPGRRTEEGILVMLGRFHDA